MTIEDLSARMAATVVDSTRAPLGVAGVIQMRAVPAAGIAKVVPNVAETADAPGATTVMIACLVRRVILIANVSVMVGVVIVPVATEAVVMIAMRRKAAAPTGTRAGVATRTAARKGVVAMIAFPERTPVIAILHVRCETFNHGPV